MHFATLMSWIICGLIAGFAARALVPGRQYMSLFMTAVLGIVGAIVGGFLYWTVMGQPGVAFSLAGSAWHGWIVTIAGAVLTLWAYPLVAPRRWWD
jgi:uncharacterized membrane protein YeaQ/YmgE (transglycosylase-associated protein family)